MSEGMQNGNKIAAADRKKITVSEAEAQRHRKQLSKFEINLKKSQEQFQSSSEQTYYIISSKFIDEWRQFCKSDKLDRLELPRYNIDLYDSQTKTLQPGLRENVDFQIINSDAMRSLNTVCKGQSLLRKARIVGHEKKIQIYLQAYDYITLSHSDLRSFENRQMDLKKFKQKLKKIEQSQQASIKQFCKTISEFENFSQHHQLRVWRISKDITVEALYKEIQDKVRNSYGSDVKIKGVGRRIDNIDTKLSDLNLQEGQFFVIENKNAMKDWYLQSDSEKKCEGCYKMKQLKFPCACKKVAYCTESCKEKDKRYHQNRCPAAQEQQLNQVIPMKVNNNSMKGLVGLSNLGNTCFMNSCLQCLSNTFPLTQYFLGSHYESQINKINPLGTKGKLAKCYAKFIKAMWCDSENTFSPYNLKSAVSQIAPMFSGYAQHDSQQFFSFIVDGLHEDLNRIQKKPYVESVESKGRDDKLVALESWLAHTKRNQSIIVDLMTGQYKSKVKCPDCGKQSITFDPFITVTLPIPQENSNSIEPYVIFHNLMQDTKKISIKYTKSNIDDWLSKASEIVKIQPSRLRCYILTMSEGIYKIDANTIGSLISRIQNEGKNVFLVQLSQQEIKMKDPIELTFRFSKKSYHDGSESLWFKFPFIFERKKLNGLTLYKRILRYLYLQAYDYSSKKSSYWGSKSFDEYEKIMLKERPFTLFMRYNLKKQKHYSKIQYKYEEEIQIEDNILIQDLIEKFGNKEYEIDARFTKEGIKNFTFQNLKQFKDFVEKDRRGHYTEDITVTLEQCFQILGQPEKLEAGNQWYCPQCKEHKQATKQLSIYKAPKILILHLKRFKQKGHYRKEKNQSQVIFPMVMDFSPYVIDPTPLDTYREELIKEKVYLKPSYDPQFNTTNKAEYQLYAVSNHYGGLGGGHYTAFGKNANGKWYEFNDSSVRSASESSVCSSGAYILFYKRKD